MLHCWTRRRYSEHLYRSQLCKHRNGEVLTSIFICNYLTFQLEMPYWETLRSVVLGNRKLNSQQQTQKQLFPVDILVVIVIRDGRFMWAFFCRKVLKFNFGSQRTSLYFKWSKTLEHLNWNKFVFIFFYHYKGIFDFSWKYDNVTDTYLY